MQSCCCRCLSICVPAAATCGADLPLCLSTTQAHPKCCCAGRRIASDEGVAGMHDSARSRFVPGRIRHIRPADTEPVLPCNVARIAARGIGDSLQIGRLKALSSARVQCLAPGPASAISARRKISRSSRNSRRATARPGCARAFCGSTARRRMAFRQRHRPGCNRGIPAVPRSRTAGSTLPPTGRRHTARRRKPAICRFLAYLLV